jgi:hypothetical protein
MSEAVLCIEPVTTQRELEAFIRFQFHLYRDDPYWVPPLLSERRDHFSTKKNPFFEHAAAQLWVAKRGDEIVGRIAAIDDEMHRQVWNDNLGFFGEFETINDQAVAQALLGAASHWLAARGRTAMRGPMNLNINDECGLLVDGFDGRPVVMMPYNPPYYAPLLEEYGLAKAKDLYAYKVDIARFGPELENLPARVKRVAKIAQDRYGIRVRKLVRKRLDEEVDLIKPVYREAWAQNWGAVPMTDAEFDHLAHNLAMIVDDDLCYLAFEGDRPIGCSITLPDLNQVAAKMKGGLFPFGWYHYLFGRRNITGLRVLIMGVLQEHRLKGVEALFYQETCRAAVKKGFEWAEMSWILEDNYNIRRGIEMMGGEIYRTYRFYEKPID